MKLTKKQYYSKLEFYQGIWGFLKASLRDLLKLGVSFLLLLVFALMSCKSKADKPSEVTKLPYFNSADFTPEWNTPRHKIPEFSFTNQNGMETNTKTYEGKIYVADFFFTSCPGICPKLTKNMGVIQEAYKNDNDILLLSHTVMPWKDSVPLLKEYAVKHRVLDEKWNLVTGDKDQLYHIARHGYFADEDFTKTQDESDFIHTENLVLVDKKGYIRGVYNGTLEIDIERLKRHIGILRKET
ncbi:SCO family protein [Tamlana sp. 2201CG12-4]|uniref:SCO family protein n=1 Tax=Tamlana sp. 2201CG12-4 TaxID=3112582 RepID=UPI002DB9ED38|nr:SCO family protein [Tamlana sp. 2201CG12-4]MEC3908345.1 SCO family protein [Tamlana sp. 2201CG12-4]